MRSGGSAGTGWIKPRIIEVLQKEYATMPALAAGWTNTSIWTTKKGHIKGWIMRYRPMFILLLKICIMTS
jgi:hypothetical protein